jgi:hypothetical protein
MHRWPPADDYVVDIQRDAHGQFFDFRAPEPLIESLELTVMQSEPRERHLLLLVRKKDGSAQLDRFLCGHDEREWFVAAVPGGASSVRQAMSALQPGSVHESMARHGVSARKRYARKNRAFRRQGEWFFVPEPGLEVEPKFVLTREPLRRGAGKPHLVEQVYLKGGVAVHVCGQHPNGLTSGEYAELLHTDPKAAHWGWRIMHRDMEVFARGTVRHSDHATITLPFWHRVLMNTETQTRTMAKVAFLD